jgi:hypothetical protein
VSLFDGQTQFVLDGDEFIRIQRKSKDEPASSGPYNFGDKGFDGLRSRLKKAGLDVD